MSAEIRFLHIGDYKTGTTWLQRHVFGADPRIYLAGEGQSDLEAKIWAALEFLTYTPTLDEPRWQSQFFQLLREQALNSERITGISRESLICGDPFHFHNWRQMAKRMRAVFGPVKIIITFREQVALLPSLYSTYVKLGGTKNMKELFLDPSRIAQFHERLDYREISAYYSDLFGTENCLFMDYKELQLNPEAYIAKLYDFIGLKPLLIQHNLHKRPNPSLTMAGAAFQRFMNRGVRSIFNRATNPPIFEKMIGVGVRLVKKIDVSLQKKRLSYLDIDTLRETGCDLPIENSYYLAATRKIAERIYWGRPLTLDTAILHDIQGIEKFIQTKGYDESIL